MEPILVAIGVLTLFILGMFAMFAKFYLKIEQGHALIVNTLRAEPEVTFTGRDRAPDRRRPLGLCARRRCH